MDHQQALATIANFLAAPERQGICLDVNQFQGLIVAVTSCPEYVSEADLVFEVMGECDEGIDQWFDEGELREAWITYLNHIDETLALEQYSLADHYPVNEAVRGPSAELSRWCDGYLRGYMITEAEWQEVHDFLKSQGMPEVWGEHESLLSMLAAFEDWDGAQADNEDPERLKQGFPMMFQAVASSINNFHKIGMLMEENRLRGEEDQAPYVREEVKVGRNDPCPCGSGKKYKKCCLH